MAAGREAVVRPWNAMHGGACVAGSPDDARGAAARDAL